MFIVRREPLLELLLLSLDQRVLVLHLELAVNSNLIDLLIDFLADDGMQTIGLLKAHETALLLLSLLLA